MFYWVKVPTRNYTFVTGLLLYTDIQIDTYLIIWKIKTKKPVWGICFPFGTL